MIELPPSLAPWAAQLSLFSKDVALALGAAVSRLSPLVGAAHSTPAPAGDPDGYDGLASRGTYDRLLATEWMLLEEMPDEFLRKVTAGEHAFLRPARRLSAAGKRCVVLFDAGVDQLGGPRIGQLAILIVMARRAEEQRATLEWGVLQDAELELLTGVTRESILSLLAARCDRSVLRKDLDAWEARLRGVPSSETWLVGALALGSEARRLDVSSIAIEDRIDPEQPRRLQVQATRSAREPALEAILEMPADPVAVRVLRDPFVGGRATRSNFPVSIRAQSTMVFSPDSRLLYLRAGPATLVGIPVPQSPRATVGPPSVFSLPPDQQLLAVGMARARRRTHLLAARGNELLLHVLSKRRTTIVESRSFLPRPGTAVSLHAPSRLRPLGLLNQGRVVFVDADGTLVELHEGRYWPTDQTKVLESKLTRGAFRWATSPSGTPKTWWRYTYAGAAAEARAGTVPEKLPQAADDAPFLLGAEDRFAYPTSDGSWVVASQSAWKTLPVGGELTVCGVLPPNDAPSETALLALDDSNRRLEMIFAEGSKTLLTTGAPITGVQLAADHQYVAFVTQSGEVGVYSAHTGALLVDTFAEVAP